MKIVVAILLLSLCASVSAQTSSIASLTYPQSGSIQVDPNTQFSWTAVAGVQAYYLYVGSAPGFKDIYDGGETTSTTVSVRLGSGVAYYARLYTKINNTWSAAPDVSFTTVAPAVLQAPANLSSNLKNPVVFTWNIVSGAQAYYLYVGTAIGAKDAYDSGEVQANQLSRMLPPGSYYARLYTEINQHWYASPDSSFSVIQAAALILSPDPFLQKWSIADATFGILYFDPATQTGQSVEEIQSLVLANDFGPIHVTPVTSYGTGVMTAYYLDPLTLYVNVTPPNQPTAFGPQPHSAFQFLQEVPVQNVVGQAGFSIFTFGNQTEQAEVDVGDGSTATLTPLNGTQFSTAIILYSGWSMTSSPIDLKAYAFIRPVY